MSYALQPAHPGQPQGLAWVSDQRVNPVEVTLAWVLTVVTLGYFLPWAIAATRGKRNAWVVGLVCLLTGWTFVGWVAALVMACLAHGVQPAISASPQQAVAGAQPWTAQQLPPQGALPAAQPAYGAYGAPAPAPGQSGYNPYA